MKIRIDGLEVPAIIGVREREREIPQTLLVDVEFEVPPPEQDGLDVTVDYSAVGELVREHIQAGRFRLIETAAATTVERVARDFGLDDVWVRIVKPAASSTARFVSAEHRLSPG